MQCNGIRPISDADQRHTMCLSGQPSAMVRRLEFIAIMEFSRALEVRTCLNVVKNLSDNFRKKSLPPRYTVYNRVVQKKSN